MLDQYAALDYWYRNKSGKVNINDDMQGSYLGPEFMKFNEKTLIS